MRPVTQQTALSNIRKAYAIFRGRKQMGQRYLWTEEQLLLGERSVVLGLLEDVHRCYDGAAPRPVHLLTVTEESPYLGKYAVHVGAHQHQHQHHYQHQQQQQQQQQHQHQHQQQQQQQPARATLESEGVGIPSPHSYRRQGELAGQGSRHSREELTITPGEHQPQLDQAKRQLTAGWQQAVGTNDIFVDAQRLDQRRDIVPNPVQEIARTAARTSTSAHTAPGARSPPLVVTIWRWLSSIGIELPSPEVLLGKPQTGDQTGDPDQHPAQCALFSDGLLLCAVVEAVEHRSIEGVCKKPNARANCLHNLRKAMGVLQQRKTMPMDYLHSHEQIYAGYSSSTVLLPLLDQIRRAYGHHLTARRKTE
jgi:hypothetical protein